MLRRNEVLQTAYSDTFLLPHLKDLSSQHVIVSDRQVSVSKFNQVVLNLAFITAIFVFFFLSD